MVIGRAEEVRQLEKRLEEVQKESQRVQTALAEAREHSRLLTLLDQCIYILFVVFFFFLLREILLFILHGYALTVYNSILEGKERVRDGASLSGGGDRCPA